MFNRWTCRWAVVGLASVLLAGCGGATPSSGPAKQTPPADKKPADKDGKVTPPSGEIG